MRNAKAEKNKQTTKQTYWLSKYRKIKANIDHLYPFIFHFKFLDAGKRSVHLFEYYIKATSDTHEPGIIA